MNYVCMEMGWRWLGWGATFTRWVFIETDQAVHKLK